MNRYFISGFPPQGTKGMKVALFDGATYHSPNAAILAEPIPDKEGVVRGVLDRKWKGNELVTLFLASEYIEENLTIEKTQLGFFHTIRIREETNLGHSPTHKWPVNSEEWFKFSESKTMEAFRKAKHKNFLSIAIFAISTVLGCFVGYTIVGYLGLLLGCVCAIISILISRYANGEMKGI